MITDSLDMDAITKTIEPKRASMLAHQAGCDILLYTKYSKRFEESFEALVKAVLSGKISRERLAASLSRRGALIHRLRSSPRRRALTGRDAYVALRERVLAKSLRLRDPKRLLPVSPKKLALVSTHSEIRARLRSYVHAVSEARAPADQDGSPLLLWLMEPLKLTCPLECMKDMVERSSISILVTSYRALAGLLSKCDISIITYDTSPQTQDVILELLFGKRGAI